MDDLNVWEGWSDWAKLAELTLEAIENAPGTYAIATREEIARVVGKDPDGILDVGESEYLRDRLRAFIRCAQDPDAYGHMAGVRFAFLGFSGIFPFDSLWVRWRLTKNKAEAYAMEGRLLSAYVNLHKELPPLNYKYNWSNHA